VYNAARTHNVQLTVTDSNGQTATVTESVSVTEP
jgi:PKD repeat protein